MASQLSVHPPTSTVARKHKNAPKLLEASAMAIGSDSCRWFSGVISSHQKKTREFGQKSWHCERVSFCFHDWTSLILWYPTCWFPTQADHQMVVFGQFGTRGVSPKPDSKPSISLARLLRSTWWYIMQRGGGWWVWIPPKARMLKWTSSW